MQICNDQILIIGAGPAGMSAALDAAKLGYRVTLVEKDKAMGGVMGHMLWRSPQQAPYLSPEGTGIDFLTAAIGANDRITVLLNASVDQVSEVSEHYLAEIHYQDPGQDTRLTQTDRFAHVFEATGQQLDASHPLLDLATASPADAITQMELEEWVMENGDNPIPRPSDNQPVESVLFIADTNANSNTGTGTGTGLPYAVTAMKQAMYFKDNDPSIDTVILTLSLNYSGPQAEGVFLACRRKGVTFVIGEANKITASDNGPSVAFHDQTLNEEPVVNFDLVVLATSMYPGKSLFDNTTMLGSARQPMDMQEAMDDAANIICETLTNLSSEETAHASGAQS